MRRLVLGTAHGTGMTDAGRVIAAATAIFSIAAGVIHISAAADHENLPVMMAGFLVIGCLQGALGGLLLWRRPDPLLIVAALALMLGSVGVWLMSRTMGLPFLPGGHMEPIGFKDAVTVLFELATVPGLLLLLSREASGMSLPSPRLGTRALGFLGAAAFALMVPALVLGGGGHHSADQMAHAHGDAAEEDGHAHAMEEGEHGHTDGEAHADSGGDHGHAGEGGGHDGDQQGGGHGHDDGGDDASFDLAQADAHDEGHGGGSMDTGGEHGHGGSGGGHAETHSGGERGGDEHAGGGHEGGEHDDGGGGHGDGDHGREKTGGHGKGGHEDGGGHGKGGHGGEEGHDEGGHDGGHGGGGEHEMARTTPPATGIVTERLTYMTPKPAGTRETIKLQYGPYPVLPGGDASQVGVDVAGADGMIVSAKPSIRYADGSAVMHDDGVHLHHAHLFHADGNAATAQSDGRPGYEWVFGTGDEQTMGSFDAVSDADPRGHRYGVALQAGEPMLMVWMPMNMTDQEKSVYLEFEFEFMHGTPEELGLATGKTYKPLRPVLYGQTFNVPKTGGLYAWPLDATRVQSEDPLDDTQFDHETFMTTEPTHNATPGVGDIWTAPEDGELIGAAGHGHEGIANVTFSNLGSEASPCPEDGDRFPGTTILESTADYPPGLYPTHLKMGTSQTGWRVKVRKGDRIAINGVYDTTMYAWPDQMSVVGIYYDPDVEVADDERCTPRLVDEPDATPKEAAQSVLSQSVERGQKPEHLHHDMGEQPCVADDCNDYGAPPPPRGPHTTTINIEDFTFSPGDLKRSSLVDTLGPSMGGAPVVNRGEQLTFVNHDYVLNGGTRHSITSCHGPCNGPETMTYPNSDGRFYSGPMGYVPLAETASSENQGTPTWTLDTSSLEPGHHAFYCFQHRWMRGSFYVE